MYNESGGKSREKAKIKTCLVLLKPVGNNKDSFNTWAKKKTGLTRNFPNTAAFTMIVILWYSSIIIF